jgi:hypothetical protein
MSPCRMLNEYNVVLDAILLKPNMVLPGMHFKVLHLNPNRTMCDCGGHHHNHHRVETEAHC